jgi:hypothetical protein
MTDSIHSYSLVAVEKKETEVIRHEGRQAEIQTRQTRERSNQTRRQAGRDTD